VTLDRDQIEAVETLRRELNRTITNRDTITLTREDASTLSHLITDLIAETKDMSASKVYPVLVTDEGRSVQVGLGFTAITLSAQQAYDLHQAIGRVLPSLVQPFKPWPREDES
jgi:hypothetical protein